jgi:hypothetical protein
MAILGCPQNPPILGDFGGKNAQKRSQEFSQADVILVTPGNKFLENFAPSNLQNRFDLEPIGICVIGFL